MRRNDEHPEGDADFRTAYDALGPQVAIARALIAARSRAGLSQAEVADRMGVRPSHVARMESGAHLPSTRSLLRYAEATGSSLELVLAVLTWFFGFVVIMANATAAAVLLRGLIMYVSSDFAS